MRPLVGGPGEKGGATGFETERCTLIAHIQFNTTIQCSTVDPKYPEIPLYPEMMRVPHDYCQKKNEA